MTRIWITIKCLKFDCGFLDAIPSMLFVANWQVNSGFHDPIYLNLQASNETCAGLPAFLKSEWLEIVYSNFWEIHCNNNLHTVFTFFYIVVLAFESRIISIKRSDERRNWYLKTHFLCSQTLLYGTDVKIWMITQTQKPYTNNKAFRHQPSCQEGRISKLVIKVA